MVFPKVTVECAFVTAPLASSPVWTDITADITAARVNRGRQHELGQMQAGTCDLTIAPHRFTRYLRWNMMSPYYGNLLTENQSSVETAGTTGFVNFSNCTIAGSTAVANHGTHSLAVTTTTGGSDSLFKTSTGTNAVPIPEGATLTGLVSFRTSLGVFRTCKAFLTFYDAFGGAMSDSVGSGVTAQQSVWTEASVTATAPATARYVSLGGVIQGAGSSEVNYADTLALMGGPTPLPWHLGGKGSRIRPMVKTRVTAQWNLLTASQSTFISGWAPQAGGNCTVTAGTMSPTLAGQMSAETPRGTSGTPVIGGRTYSVFGKFQSSSTSRVVQVAVTWFDASGTMINGVLNPNTNSDNSSGATQTPAWNVTAPAGAAFANIVAYVYAATEAHYPSNFGLFPAADVTVWSAGGPYYRFTGYAESFRPRQQDVVTGNVELHAVDGFKVLNLAKLVGTAYRDAVLADSPTAYYRLAENVNGATSGTHPAAVDASGNGNVGQYFGSPTFAAVSPLVAEVDTAVDFGVRQSYVLLNSAVTPSGSSAFTIEGWVWPRSLPVATFGDRIWSGQTNAGQQLHLYFKSNGKLRFFAGDGTNGGYVESSVALTLSAWSHVVAVRAAGAPTGWRIYVNGVDVTTGATTDTGTGDPSLPVSTSMIGGKDTGGGIDTPAFDGKIDEFAVWAATALTSGQVAAHWAATFGFAGNSLAGARLANLLDLSNWPAADRVIDTGQFQMQPITTSLQTASALAIANQLVESEGYPAALFFDGQGRAVFQDRAHATPASSGTFGDAAGELHPAAYSTWQPDVDDLDLWNEIVLQAANGVAQTASDATSQDDYVKRTMPPKTGLSNASDADVQTLATALLARSKDPQVRLKSMTIHPPDDPGNLYPQALGRDLNDRITANQHYFAGAASSLTLDLRIEGIEDTIDLQAGDWTTRWELVPA